jgi:hypothetical protein
VTEIWKHHQGYGEAVARIRSQTAVEDLYVLDCLYGREALKFGDGPAEIKAEALRQTEIEWRKERNKAVEFFSLIARGMFKGGGRR